MLKASVKLEVSGTEATTINRTGFASSLAYKMGKSLLFMTSLC